jgi:phage/plasmid-associated DNA primase
MTSRSEAAAVTVATAAYRESEDALGAFLVEHTIEVKGTKTNVGAIYDVWRLWCETSGERPGRKQDFTAALEDRGHHLESYQHAKQVLDLGIRATGEVS